MARKAGGGRKGRGKEQEVEVEVVGAEEDAAPAAPPAGLETAIVFVTFAALLAAFVLVNLRLKSAFEVTWPF